MRVGDRELKPGIGYALVKEVELGTSAGGIVFGDVRAIAKAGKETPALSSGVGLEIVEVHPYSIDCGQKVEHDFRPGDRVAVAPGGRITGMPHWPAKHGVIRIEHLCSFEREERQTH